MILSEPRSLTAKTSLMWKDRIELDKVLQKNEEIVKSARRTLLATRKLIAIANEKRVSSSDAKYHEKLEDRSCSKIDSKRDIRARPNLDDSPLIHDNSSFSPAESVISFENEEHGNISRARDGLDSPRSESTDDSVEIRIGNVFSRKEINSYRKFEPTSDYGAEMPQFRCSNDMAPTSMGRILPRHPRSKLDAYRRYEESFRPSRHDRDFVYEIKTNISVQPKYSFYSSDRDARQRCTRTDRSEIVYPSSYVSVPVVTPPHAYSFQPPINNREHNDAYGEKENANSPPQQVVMKNKKPGYLCNQCGKVYCRKYVLKIHQRVHSGEKPLQCRVCGKCFSDPSNMKKHVKLHDAEQVTYPCKFCGRHFIRRRGLLNHMQSIHSKNVTGDYLKEFANDLISEGELV